MQSSTQCCIFKILAILVSRDKTNQLRSNTLSVKQLCTLVGYSIVQPGSLNLVGCPPML
jgi:hypothetical protein